MEWIVIEARWVSILRKPTRICIRCQLSIQLHETRVCRSKMVRTTKHLILKNCIFIYFVAIITHNYHKAAMVMGFYLNQLIPRESDHSLRIEWKISKACQVQVKKTKCISIVASTKYKFKSNNQLQYIDMSQERTIAFGLLLIVGLLFGSLFAINLIDFFLFCILILSKWSTTHCLIH